MLRSCLLVIFAITVHAPAMFGQDFETRPTAATRETAEALVTIRGRVIDAKGAPVPNATVELPRPERTTETVLRPSRRRPLRPYCLRDDLFDEPHFLSVATDNNGRFVASVPAERAYWCRVEAKGFAFVNMHGLRPEGPDLEIVLQPGASIVGRVVSSDGVPIAGAAIGGGPRFGGGAGTSTHSRPDGTFELDGLPTEIDWVEVQHRDYLPRDFPGMRLDRAEPRTMTVVLDPGHSIRGEIIDVRTGGPIKGATIAVEAYSRTKPSVRCKTTSADAAGAFELKGLPAGRVTVGIVAPGHVERVVEGSVTQSERIHSVGRILLDSALAIGFRVIDEKGEAVGNATAECAEVTSRSDPSGAVRLDGLPFPVSGWLSPVAIVAQGFEDAHWTPTPSSLQPTSRPEVVLVAARCRIAGRVLDDLGRPVRGARVSASNESRRRRTVTDTEGKFWFDAVSAATWTVTALADDCQSYEQPPAIALSRGQSRDDVVINLVQMTQIKGELRDAQGEPVLHATITPIKPDSQSSHGALGTVSLTTASRFTLRVPKNEQPPRVHVTAAGFEPKDVDSER